MAQLPGGGPLCNAAHQPSLIQPVRHNLSNSCQFPLKLQDMHIPPRQINNIWTWCSFSTSSSSANFEDCSHRGNSPEKKGKVKVEYMTIRSTTRVGSSRMVGENITSDRTQILSLPVCQLGAPSHRTQVMPTLGPQGELQVPPDTDIQPDMATSTSRCWSTIYTVFYNIWRRSKRRRIWEIVLFHMCKRDLYYWFAQIWLI